MTGTCHCGALVTAPEDLVLDGGRDGRTLHQFGIAIASHLQQAHPAELNRIGDLAALMTGWLLMTHFESADPRFKAAFEDGHRTLLDLLELPTDSEAGGDPPAPKKRTNLIA